MHKAGVSQLTLAGRGRHARTAGASQTRPPWSLPLARGGAAVRPAATGTPVGVGSRRGLARDPCPWAAFELGRRRKPAKFAPQGRFGLARFRRADVPLGPGGVAVAADMPARAVPDRPRPLKQPVGHEREHEHGKQCGQADPRVGKSGISPPLGQGRGLLLLPHDVCGMGHCRHVSSITTAGGWCPESGFLTQPNLAVGCDRVSGSLSSGPPRVPGRHGSGIDLVEHLFDTHLSNIGSSAC